VEDVLALDAAVRSKSATLLAGSAAIAVASAAQLHALVCDIMKRKLTLGQFRPGLLQQCQKNSESAVKSAVLTGVKHLEDGLRCGGSGDLPVDVTTAAVEKASRAVAELGGIGPATATAVLAFAGATVAGTGDTHFGVVPFMADEAMKEVGLGSPLKYDFPTLRKFVDAVRECRHRQADAGGPSSPAAVTAAEVSEALVVQLWSS
jgi:hypothetical protein